MNTQPGSSLTLETIEAILHRLRVPYHREEDYLVMVASGRTFVVTVFSETPVVWFASVVVPGRNARGYRPASREAERNACEYLMAVNYKILLGRFARDHRDGEIRFENAISVIGSRLSQEQVNQAFGAAIHNMDQYGPTVEALLAGQVTLGQALADLDRGSSAPVAV